MMDGERNVQADDLIVVNNSFIERKSIKVKSTKSPQYLCANYDQLDNVDASGLGVCTPDMLHNNFRRYSAGSGNIPARVSLAEGIDRNLSGVGKLIFLLIGTVDDDIEVSVPLESSLCSLLRFAPTNDELLTLREGVVEVNDVKYPDALRTALAEAWARRSKSDGSIPADFEKKFVGALPVLRELVHSEIQLPEGELDVREGTLMRRMIDSLVNEIAAYDAAIARCGGDPMRDAQSFSDVLRIAYNFASDSQKLITLVVSLCDLKPLLLWATVAEHFRLSQSFNDLSGSKETKPSPTLFYSTVTGARNHAFHDLIRIDRAIQVRVEDVRLQARNLTLFAPHAKKGGNTLTYEDQELVEALTQFTHAPESVVTPEFWVRSSQVMHALAELLVAMERALFSLNNECVMRYRDGAPGPHGMPNSHQP
ncbi:hypothetical protein CLV71_103424 [Actinophytocola oryzae]|uniref:Uncharacterized protein n=2 Tax=Actinophytocola oryzae TaxID=502181 RepID=A0A4R7VYC3_9PSEU|nr:hypothetical protein CLV71_103424 [Actinophytocola oryzae]